MHVCKVYLPGAECSTGSLGHGLAVADGMAFSARQKKQAHRVFCMMGDGETCEGSVWEAANTAGSYGLGNLVGIVDKNKQLMTSFANESMSFEHYPERWEAFGWNAVEIDGHDMNQIVDALDNLPAVNSDKPTVIIANTVKGKGVSFMEGVIGWHAGALSTEDMEKAMAEIDAACEKERSAA
jgi:transketolase